MTGVFAWIVAILPGPAVSGFFLLLDRYLVGATDEYQRMLRICQMLVATGNTLTGTTVWVRGRICLVGHLVAWNRAVEWFVGLAVGAAFNVVAERKVA